MSLKKYLFVISSLILVFSSYNCVAQIPLDGLVTYYKFDGNANDSSPTGNDGIIVEEVSSTTNRFDETNRAFSFSGGHIDAGNPVEVQITEAITIAAWIKLDSISTWSGIVTKWPSLTNGGYYLGVNPDQNLARFNITMPTSPEGSSLEIGEWIHITATFDGASAKIYYDGVLADEVSHSIPIPTSDAKLIIGSQSNSLGSAFKGSIDDVLIYNRALNLEEIDMVFNDISTSTKESIYSAAVSLAPNPTHNVVNIKNTSDHKILSYSLYNSAGQELQAGTYQSELNISNQPSGLYYISLRFEDGSVTKRVLKI